MSLNLNEYQFKTSRYSYRPTHMNPTMTTSQKPPIDKQKLERKGYRHTTKTNKQTNKQKNHQTRKEQKKRKENYKNNQKTSNKLAISSYLSELNAPIKRHRVADYIKK